MKRGGPIARHTPLRSRVPLRKVNPERKKLRLERDYGGEYADMIRSLPCCVCDQPPPSDPHHVKSRGAGGDKRDQVPLCRRCHTLGHTMGWQSFQERFQIDLEAEAATLWHGYAVVSGEGLEG